ncbi:U-box domain-containing protein 44-like [Papaver somniferum]|uniref:U-box domain-containing protein 44-like n=1 Tax=Papaver somniferum TaxID=3469 RepID=UPI000E6FFBC7|nr:U-box domain-containing protein 44-like [Papaver somniferum]
MSLLELAPIGGVLTILTTQVIRTIEAARDVIVEKDSFKALSKYLSDIEPILNELHLHGLNDSEATRQALDCLLRDVKKAYDLVEKYKNKSRFYLLIKCRHIVGEVQAVTREIGRSLSLLPFSNTEVLVDISAKVNTLQKEMQRAEFEASQAQIQIVEKLNQGFSAEKVDQSFANDMLKEIARVVGVPVEPTVISKELASFKREKEDAAVRKEKLEEYFLKQVIELLSRADAAKDQEEIKKQYLKRFQIIQTREGYIDPLNSFICPIDRSTVMVDPVSLSTGTTCERAAIEAWFDSGKKTDPKTGHLLDDFSVRSNHRLREAIEEWRELNYCLQIRVVKRKLISATDSAVEEALNKMVELFTENPINKDWIAIEGLISISLSVLENSLNKDIKRKILITLQAAIAGNAHNKEIVVESRGIDLIISCLECSHIAKAAVDLLFELLQGHSGWNLFTLRKLSEQSNAINFLVVLLETESAEKAEGILLELCDDDDDIVIRVAKAHWYKPLVNRIIQGQETARTSMVRVLVAMELEDRDLKNLGEEGVIPPLLKMVSAKFEAKGLALCALVKLSSCHENKKLIANSGGVPIITEQLFSSHIPTLIIVRCTEILEKLSSNDDGTKFLVKSDGSSVDLEKIATNLLVVQQYTNSSHVIKKPALRALLNIFKSSRKLVEKAIIRADGLSQIQILPLLDDPDREIRELSISLLFHFSQHEPQGIAEFFLVQRRRLEALVGFLKDESRGDTQMAAIGLLANLPKSEVELTKKLIEADLLPSILKILRSGTTDAKENALGALFRFTDPSNLEVQRKVVDLGAYSLLVDFLKSGTVTAKARAAALIGSLSVSTPKLAVLPKSKSKRNNWNWCFHSGPMTICKAHGGICGVSSTFCLLEANALHDLVGLLEEQVYATSYEAIQALSTLVVEGTSHKGANVLDEAGAIPLVIEVLNWGASSLKEEALDLLAKIFTSRDLVEAYGPRARIYLDGLTAGNIHEGGPLGRKVSQVLALLECYSRTPMAPSERN